MLVGTVRSRPVGSGPVGSSPVGGRAVGRRPVGTGAVTVRAVTIRDVAVRAVGAVGGRLASRSARPWCLRCARGSQIGQPTFDGSRIRLLGPSRSRAAGTARGCTRRLRRLFGCGTRGSGSNDVRCLSRFGFDVRTRRNLLSPSRPGYGWARFGRTRRSGTRRGCLRRVSLRRASLGRVGLRRVRLLRIGLGLGLLRGSGRCRAGRLGWRRRPAGHASTRLFLRGVRGTDRSASVRCHHRNGFGEGLTAARCRTHRGCDGRRGRAAREGEFGHVSGGQQLVFEDGLAEAELALNALHPLRSPPAVVAEQLHRGGHEEHTNQRRVDDESGDHAVGDVLHHHQIGERERAGDDDEDQCRRGDDASGMRGSDADGFACAGTLFACLDHSGE